MEFISLGPNDEEEGNRQTEALAATAVASEPPSASANDIIDLEEGQFTSEPDAKEDQTNAVDANGLEPQPLASEHQPQDMASTVDSAKASVEIADLEEGQVACKAGAEDAQGGGDLQAEPLIVNGVDATKVSDEIIDLEEGQVEDMDLSDDGEVVVKRQTSDAPVQAQASVPALLQTLHGAVSVGIDKGNGPGIVAAQVHASSSAFIDESPTRGVKRARVESAEPSVRVIYNNLTRESKRRLMELMQQWSEWQARKQHTLTDSVEEVLECGEETYYPALHVGSERSAVSFWVDSQARGNVAVDDGAVPLYNREFTLGSTPLGDPSNTESKQDKDDSRCFNCGSYSHALKDCPKPRDHVAISNARKQHNSKRNLSNVSRGQNRYYQKTPGKFDDLKAGVLGAETRECLGLRENDPPPWLHRMRELGYPPGYLDEVEDEDKPSGITIFGDGEVKAEHEEGELPEQGEPSPPLKKMTVEFPGINAPVPENGDPWLWGSTPPQSSSGRHHHPSSDSRDRGPPGAEHYSSSRYHPYDHGPATPGLVRSHSDRGRRSASGYYDNPPPPPGEEGTWTPHAYSSRQHSSGSEMSRHSRDRERERERDWHDRHYYSSGRR
ncbi:hypothetical protein QYE76_047762 [Lolium multiflorum]|uniref:CCHC-type domain-containing protein n=1 Tax=Lolium multiflorum TaxID=4521 RepID=A0AAD8X0H2_LOLMU|nr:hypothetical protein QYE76_047762 [Lolium multiflorum]